MRTPEQVRAVLSPKTAGARALDAAVSDLDPGLFIVFSSVSAVLGAAGQIDYTAANAYLDAFARERQHRTGRRTLSLGWGAWRDVGMAAELAEAAHYGPAPGEEASASGDATLAHPLFERRLALSGGAEAFRMSLAWGQHWMLDEHRTRQGERILPGSGYVELIQSALELLDAPDHAIRNLTFLKPFKVEDGERRLLDVVLENSGSGWSVVVRGRGPDETSWSDHATARVDHTSSGSSRERLDSVLARLGAPVDTPRPAHPVMDFGPRWSNVVAAALGDGEALLAQRLPEAFHSDLAVSRLHPALFDMATAGAPDLVPGIDPSTDFLIPAGYGEVRVFGPLGPTMTSHIRLRDSDGVLASFDVTVYGDDGTVLAEVDEFSMLKVAREALSETSDARHEPDWLRHAITPAEGAELFRRIVARPGAPHLLVVPRPLEVLMSEVGQVRASSGRPASPVAPARVLLPDVAEALAAHDAVAEAAVLGSDEETAGPNRRVAFVVYHPGHQATVSELRRFLRKGIDRSAVPQNFVEMVALPRRPSGEITLEELRDPFAAADTFIAPRTPTEHAIAEIWTELLGLDRVGIHDNFLDAGGHSLVGIRVLSRIHKATGVRLEANALTLQTLEQLGAEVDRTAGDGAAA
jgi:hypothetical protein